MLAGDPALAVIHLALALIVLETAALMAYRAWSGQGPALRAFAANQFAGLFLLLVAREAVVNAGPLTIVACLTGALIAHVTELATRWQRAPRSPGPRAALGATSGPYGADRA